MSKSFDPSQTPLVAETLLKKRRSLEELALVRQETVQKQVKRRRVVRGESIRVVRPEQLVKIHRIKDGSEKRLNRERKQAAFKVKRMLKNGTNLPSTVGLIVRIREAKSASKYIKKELKSLGLDKIYSAVFMKIDEESLVRLKTLDSYIAYGFITYKSVEELVHRRAYTTVEGSKRPLNTNLIVENLLGEKNILCLSDLTHEIHTVGPSFQDALQVLTPFDLSAPLGTYEKKVLQVHSDEHGFLGEAMEDFLKKLL